jgi:hypothetical protein
MRVALAQKFRVGQPRQAAAPREKRHGSGTNHGKFLPPQHPSPPVFLSPRIFVFLLATRERVRQEVPNMDRLDPGIT